ncbi:PREDICTED: uncharacterized protein LOC109340169, partial [Lupinus angustifolius]|uniref:uncharacterized protein LOC109340169 n=1 Tax=Lupinus angustifolius TaxID=3871 RepID=UPI00092F391D
NIGQRTVLPSSFIGSRRDLTQHYEDGMAIVLNDGKLDIFLTMTCNPSWNEITSELQHFQTARVRPDLTTRIFRSKFEQLSVDVIDKGVLENVKSYMYVTEFQKRGLPHVHMLLILEDNDKLRSLEEYDAIVRAELPDYEEGPQLHHAVLKHMVHGPRSIGQIVLATATSGIATTLLPGGQTAHSRFKIPLNLDSSSVYSISKQSDLAKLITQASAIVWDEALMVNKYALEAIDQTLRDIIGCDAPFGGKVVILGGDFR